VYGSAGAGKLLGAHTALDWTEPSAPTFCI